MVASASSIGALPSGTWTATPNLPVKYSTPMSVQVYVRNATLVVAADGTRYTFYGAYSKSPSSELLLGRFTGTAVCADGALAHLLLSVDADSCDSDAALASWFCQAAPTYYAGVFSYGLYEDAHLEINGYGAAQWPFLFECVGAPGSCGSTLACNSTVNLESNFYQEGGTAIVNGSQTVILMGNSSAVFEGNDITIANTNNFTLVQSSTMNSTTVNVDGTQNTIIIQAPNSTDYNFYTLPPASCRNFAALLGTRSSNFSIATTGWTLLHPYTSSSFDAPDGDWSLLSGSNSAIQYDGSTSDAYAYVLEACLLEGAIYGADQAGLRVLITLFNTTTGTPAELAPITSSSLVYNHTNPAYVPSVCTGPIPVSAVYSGNSFAIYVAFEYTNGAALPGVILAASRWSLSATPLACRGIETNINITANFNNSQLEAGTCIDLDNPDTETIVVNSDYDVNAAGYSCFARSGSRCNRTFTFSGLCSASANGGAAVSDSINFVNSTTIAVSRSGQDFSFASLLTATGSKCYSASIDGSVLTVGGSGVCSATVAGSSSACLTAAVNSNGNLTLTTEGVCGFQDTSSVQFNSVGSGIFSAVCTGIGNGTDSWISCNGTDCTVNANVTLNVERLCASQQCEVRADPPQTAPSPGPQYVPRLCFTCGDSDGGGDGGGGGDSGGSGAPIVPLLPPIVPIGFFPPLVPVFPPTGGSGGGSGGGGGGGPPGILPILTPLPVGVTDEPITTGGLQIPPTNFTDTVVFCGSSTHGLAILENGTLPETLYICQRLFNGTYAWMPYCTCSSAQSNTTIIYYTTTVYYNSSTTLYLDSSSQLINYGNTFLETLTIGSGGASACLGPLRADNITACNDSGGQFSHRISIDASFTDVFGTLSVCNASSRYGTGAEIFTGLIQPCNTSGALFLAPSGTAYTGNVVVPSGKTLSLPNTMSATSGGGGLSFLNGFSFTTTPPLDPLFPPVCGWTCDGPSSSTAIASLSGAASAALPAIDVDGSGTFCSTSYPTQKTVTTNTILSCGGGPLSLNASSISLNGDVSLLSPTVSYPSLPRASCNTNNLPSCAITLNAQRGLVRVNVTTFSIGPGSCFSVNMSNTYANAGSSFALVQTVEENYTAIPDAPPVMFASASTQSSNLLIIRACNPTPDTAPMNNGFTIFFNIVSYT